MCISYCVYKGHLEELLVHPESVVMCVCVCYRSLSTLKRCMSPMAVTSRSDWTVTALSYSRYACWSEKGFCAIYMHCMYVFLKFNMISIL